MLSNTSTTSLLLYGVFITLSIIAMFFAFHFIKKGNIEAERLDKMIELFKYTIVSTAIATTTLVVADLFKEREQDISELEYFDKYVEDVKKVDGVEERLLLSKYLSIVAPSGEMKKSWKTYYDTVEVEYNRYLQLKKALAILSDTNYSSAEEYSQKSGELIGKIYQFEKPLSTNTIQSESEWLIITGGDRTFEDAEFELKKALKLNPNSTIYKKENSYRTTMGGYFSKSEAEAMLSLAKKQLNPSSYIVRKDSWCKNIRAGDECLECE